MNLYGIHEILEAENPRVFDWVYLTLLSTVVERDVMHGLGLAGGYKKFSRIAN
jgi:hypothetical protein